MKLSLKLKDKSILQHVVQNALDARVGEVIVVLGREARRLRAEIPSDKVKAVENKLYEQGQSTSLQAGLAAVSPDAKAALILLGDQPFVKAGIINAIIDEYERSGALIVAPLYGGKRGNPVLFDRSLFPELLTTSGDRGGREVIERHSEALNTVKVDSALAAKDIDNWDDYLALCSYLEAIDPSCVGKT